MSHLEAFKQMANSAALTLVIIFIFTTAFLFLWSLKHPTRYLED